MLSETSDTLTRVSNALGMERTTEEIATSDRSFGLMFALILALVLGLLRWRYESLADRVSPILLVLTALCLCVALVRPRLLRPLNRCWMIFSMLLGRIMSPIVLAVLYYFLISPLAIALRLGGRDKLRLRSASVESHWHARGMCGYTLHQFRDQY
jgi:hypothetical protein